MLGFDGFSNILPSYLKNMKKKKGAKNMANNKKINKNLNSTSTTSTSVNSNVAVDTSIPTIESIDTIRAQLVSIADTAATPAAAYKAIDARVAEIISKISVDDEEAQDEVYNLSNGVKTLVANKAATAKAMKGAVTGVARIVGVYLRVIAIVTVAEFKARKEADIADLVAALAEKKIAAPKIDDFRAIEAAKRAAKAAGEEAEKALRSYLGANRALEEAKALKDTDVFEIRVRIADRSVTTKTPKGVFSIPCNGEAWIAYARRNHDLRNPAVLIQDGKGRWQFERFLGGK
jgi:hypothetical protein